MTRVAVLGAGAWGTAIAWVLAARLEVTLWARDPAQAEAMARTRRNERYLPGVEIPSAVKVTADFPARRRPRSWPRRRSPDCASLQNKPAPLVWLCKGFEQGTGSLPHQIVEPVDSPVAARCRVLRSPTKWRAACLAR